MLIGGDGHPANAAYRHEKKFQRRAARSACFRSRRCPHSATSSSGACESLLVTHPFHPLAGQRLLILVPRRYRSLGRVYVCDGGSFGNVTLPEEFTDRGMDPAPSPVTLEALIELAAVVAAVKKRA